MIKRDHFLLRGRLRCGICGTRMVCRSGARPEDRYYTCYNRCASPYRREAAGIEKCNGPYVKMEELDGAIETDILNRFFRKPKETLQHWCKDEDGSELRLKRLERQLKRIDEEIADQEKQSDKLLDAFLE
jgi:hypothetical protein